MDRKLDISASLHLTAVVNDERRREGTAAEEVFCSLLGVPVGVTDLGSGKMQDQMEHRKKSVLNAKKQSRYEGLRRRSTFPSRSPPNRSMLDESQMDALDSAFRAWLEAVALELDVEVDEAARAYGASDVHNRQLWYPRVAAALSSSKWSIGDLSDPLLNCWAVTARSAVIRLRLFLSYVSESRRAIEALIHDFPADDRAVSVRVMAFVEEAAKLGYAHPTTGHRDDSGAAQVASVLLTSVMPDRFVDYRQNRWRKLALALAYPIAVPHDYGDQLIWAGRFAGVVTATSTFQEYFPMEPQPTWVLAGLCWEQRDSTDNSRSLPVRDPVDLDFRSFPEGELKRRMHFVRERDHRVVKIAKAAARKVNPLLPCEACGFSFAVEYGAIGVDVIEAHHTRPIATLSPGSSTKPEDIAMLCANCHRIAHRGEHDVLTVAEIKTLIAEAKKPRLPEPVAELK